MCTTRMNLVYWDPCAGCCKPLCPSPSQLDSPWFRFHIPLQAPWCKMRIGSPTKQLTMQRRYWLPPWVFFYWRNWRLRGDLSTWCHTVLGVRQYGQHVGTCLILIEQSFWVSEVDDDGSFSPTYSRIFSVVSWIVVGLFVRGSKVRNNLCHVPELYF